VPLTYQAYNADSCSVGTPTTTALARRSPSNGVARARVREIVRANGATLSIPTIASHGHESHVRLHGEGNLPARQRDQYGRPTVTKPRRRRRRRVRAALLRSQHRDRAWTKSRELRSSTATGLPRRRTRPTTCQCGVIREAAWRGRKPRVGQRPIGHDQFYFSEKFLVPSMTAFGHRNGPGPARASTRTSSLR
jgi:hypothetical protein